MATDIHPLLKDFVLDEQRLGPSLGLSRRALGQNLLACVMGREAFSGLIGAIEAAPTRPPQPALDRYLLEEIGIDTAEDASKILVGRYVRQLVEHAGFAFVRSNVEVTEPSIFANGAIYRRRGAVGRAKMTAAERRAWAERRIAELRGNGGAAVA